MRAKRAITVIVALICATTLSTAQYSAIYEVIIPEFTLRESSPSDALAQFYEVWKTVAGAYPMPAYIFAGSTNGPSKSFPIDVHQASAQRILTILDETLSLRSTVYTNGIVFFPTPIYSAAIQFRDIPIRTAVTDALGLGLDGNGNPKDVETFLRRFGLYYPCAGCTAVYLPTEGLLRMSHVPNELDKADFLIKQINNGVSLNDVAIDPTAHISIACYVYEKSAWIKFGINPKTGQQGVPDYRRQSAPQSEP